MRLCGIIQSIRGLRCYKGPWRRVCVDPWECETKCCELRATKRARERQSREREWVRAYRCSLENEAGAVAMEGLAIMDCVALYDCTIIDLYVLKSMHKLR